MSSHVARGGVPTLRSMDHVAFTVPDLNEAVTFFSEHFGGVLVYTDGPFSGDGTQMTDRLGVDQAATLRIAMLRLGTRTNLELFEYEVSSQASHPPANSDIGGHHLAFYVDDIEAARDYLKRIPGVRLLDGPNDVDPEAPVAGQRWFYFTSPWGMTLELTSDSTGRYYRGLPADGMVPPAGPKDPVA